MKRIAIFCIGLLAGLQSYSQQAQDISLKIFTSSKSPKYQEEVEFKAYLYNHTSNAIKLSNPRNSEPAWNIYISEWTIKSLKNKKVNKPEFICGTVGPFNEKCISTLNPGDSLYVSYYKFKFDSSGAYSVTYKLDHHPKNSPNFGTNQYIQLLSAFSAQSKPLQTTVAARPTFKSFKAAAPISKDQYDQEKTYTQINDAFSNAEKVYKLVVSDISQEDFNDICRLKNLRYLEIGKSKIKNIPVNLGDLDLTYLALREISPVHGQDTLRIPKSIGKMSNLAYFYISGIWNITLPKEFSNLKSLVDFAITHTNLEIFPGGFENFQNLTQIMIYANPSLGKLPAGLSKLTKLINVTFANCPKIKEFPYIFNSPEIYALDLSSDSITEIPDSIGKLKKLQIFTIGDNKIAKLPQQLLELPALNFFNIQRNFIAKDDKIVLQLKSKPKNRIFN